MQVKFNSFPLVLLLSYKYFFSWPFSDIDINCRLKKKIEKSTNFKF